MWKSGAEIYRDQSDGRLGLKNAKSINSDVMKSAEIIFGEIDSWFKSWESANAQDKTIQKALYVYCGWQSNQKINDWLENDNESLMLLHDWTVELAKNGWTSIYADHREYENEKTNEMKKEFYKKAIEYTRKGKAN